MNARALKIACEERDRLHDAYNAAQSDTLALESRLSSQIQSANQGERRRAKSEIERGELHQAHVLEELLKHEKNHGVVDEISTARIGNTWQQLKPRAVG
jgi:hypothetical protein